VSDVVHHLKPVLPAPLAAARPRLRIGFGATRRLGPGKIDLIQAIAETGSITAAARSMGMSYRRAWVLVDETNRIFETPLVTATAGGQNGGGARVTEFGLDVVAAWRRIEAKTRAAIDAELAPFADRLVDFTRDQTPPDVAPVDRSA
jgi:molybdate transport system regulatory protein